MLEKLRLLLLFLLCLDAVTLKAQSLRVWKNPCSQAFDIYLPDQKYPAIGINPAKQAFITAAQKTTRISNKMASFHFKHRFKKQCRQPLIDTMQQPDSQTFIVSGHFVDCTCRYTMHFAAADSTTLTWNIQLSDTTYNFLQVRYHHAEDEQCWGFGEQFSHVNMKGKQPVMWSEEQGIGRGDKPVSRWLNLFGVAGNTYTTYYPTPFYLTNRHRAVFLENIEYSRFDFSRPHRAIAEVWSSRVAMRIFQADTPLQLIEKFAQYNGKQPPLPDWAYGTWVGIQGGSNKARQVVAQAKAADNPVRAVWLQDWVGRRKTRFGSQLWWTWMPDTLSYPNFADFCAEMKHQDVRVLGYINSFVASTGKFCDEGLKNGYFVSDKKGEPYRIATAGFPAYLVDLTNPEAYKWLKSIIKSQMIDVGMSGWMADYGEWLPTDAQLYSGESAEVYHNRYPVVWAQLNREAIDEAGKTGEIVFFTRAGFSGSPRYSTLFWAGDQLLSWGKNDGLPSVVPAMLSCGMSGTPFVHADAGGYTNINLPFLRYKRDRELLFRWLELATLQPVFRTHEGLQPARNQQVYTDTATVHFYAKMGQLHAALQPYFKRLATQASLTAAPLIRHTYLNYPDDTLTYALDYQFMLGKEILALPVLAPKTNVVFGYFPEGKWQNIWTGEIWEGKQFHTVPAPLGEPAIFIQIGGENYDLLYRQLIKDKIPK